MPALEDINQWFQTIGLHLLIVLIVAFIIRHIGGALIIYIVNNGVRKRKFGRDLSDDDLTKRRDTLKNMLTVIWRALVVIVAIFIMASIALPDINLAPLFASAGIIGIALGFGAQSIIKDFLAGVFIIVENQYRVGDYVEIDGLSGTVERLSIRLTVLRAFDGDVHYLTNGNISHVTNMTMQFGKVNFTLRFDPATDIDKMIKVIDQVGEQVSADAEFKDKITEKPAFYRIAAVTGSYIEVYVLGQTITGFQWSIEGEMRKRLIAACRSNGLKLANLPVSLIESS